MFDLLNWTIESDFAITSPQIIAYKDENGNVTALPPLQFIATAESLEERIWHPVVMAVDGDGVVVWKMAYREHDTFESAFDLAIGTVESVFMGSWEDGHLHHDMLNAWACEILSQIGRKNT